MNIYLTTTAFLVCFLALGGLGDDLFMADLCRKDITDETLALELDKLSNDKIAIELCDNQLKSFDRDMFRRFEALDELVFDDNPELGFPPDGSPFLVVKSLTKLKCIKCGVEKIFNRSLQDLPKIERINLTSNRITEIERLAFRENRELQLIDLKYNLLERVPSDLIEDLRKIEQLDLSFNQKLNVEGDLPFLISNSLKDLKCEGCGFKVIYEQTFAKLVNLQTLDLKGNSIVEVKSNAFQPLIKLENLSLQNNQIVIIYDELLINEKLKLCLDNNTDELLCKLQDIENWSRFECHNNTKPEVDCNQFTVPPTEPTTIVTEISVFALTPNTTITVSTTTTTVTTTTTEVTTKPAVVPKSSPEPMGISDWYISSYLTIIILTQIGALVILTGVWLKMQKYDADPELDSLAGNILNPSSIYRPLY